MSISPILLLFLAMAIAGAPAPTKATNPRYLDETTAAGGSPDDQVKCGGCPCNKPCYSSPPPPPPPQAKKPGLNCPPPPSGGGLAPPSYIYITGPPGNLYPVDPYASSAPRSFWAAPPLVAVVGLLGMVAFW